MAKKKRRVVSTKMPKKLSMFTVKNVYVEVVFMLVVKKGQDYVHVVIECPLFLKFHDRSRKI